MLGVIIIVRLQAMYQRSRKMTIFLVVFFLAIQIASGVLKLIDSTSGNFSGDEYVLSGAHFCAYERDGDIQFLVNMTWILGTTWEALALLLAVWIAVKHFRELPRPTRWAIEDCYTTLVKTHVFYFASFAFLSFLQIIENYTPFSIASEVYGCVLEVTQAVQMFVLGPRLILGVREYHANVVAHSDEGTGMASIVFQERIQITTGGGV